MLCLLIYPLSLVCHPIRMYASWGQRFCPSSLLWNSWLSAGGLVENRHSIHTHWMSNLVLQVLPMQALLKSEVASCLICYVIGNSALLVHLVDWIVTILLSHSNSYLNVIILLTNLNLSFSNIKLHSFHSDFREKKIHWHTYSVFSITYY